MHRETLLALTLAALLHGAAAGAQQTSTHSSSDELDALLGFEKHRAATGRRIKSRHRTPISPPTSRRIRRPPKSPGRTICRSSPSTNCANPSLKLR